MIKKKYRALRFVAFICQVLAWVSLVLGILGAIGAVIAGLTGYISMQALENLNRGNSAAFASVVAGIASAIGIIVFGVINFIVLLASAEYLYVLIDTEQNTRISADYLRQLLQAQQPAQPVAAPQVMPASAALPYREADPSEPTVTTPTTPLPKE